MKMGVSFQLIDWVTHSETGSWTSRITQNWKQRRVNFQPKTQEIRYSVNSEFPVFKPKLRQRTRTIVITLRVRAEVYLCYTVLCHRRVTNIIPGKSGPTTDLIQAFDRIRNRVHQHSIISQNCLIWSQSYRVILGLADLKCTRIIGLSDPETQEN